MIGASRRKAFKAIVTSPPNCTRSDSSEDQTTKKDKPPHFFASVYRFIQLQPHQPSPPHLTTMCGNSQTPWPIQTGNGSLSPSSPLIRAVQAKDSSLSKSACSNGHIFESASDEGSALEFKALKRSHLKGACDGVQLLFNVGTACLQSGLFACENLRCVLLADCLRQKLPPCDWTSFREWMITAIACWGSTPATYRKLGEPLGMLDLKFCMEVIGYYGPKIGRMHLTVPKPCLDIIGVLSLLHWTTLAVSLQYGSEGWEHFAFNLNDLYRPYITQHLEQCRRVYHLRGFRICPSRLWNVLISSGNQLMDLIAILEALNQSSSSVLEALNQSSILASGARHDSCTAQLCMFADDNSTNITQLHKCSGSSGVSPSPKCLQTIFSPDDLRKLLSKHPSDSWICTAWDIRKWENYSTGKLPPSNTLLLRQPSSRYIAVSHVWGDGTGVGISSPGNVNSCLAAYFARIATRLNCDGIWWDSICIPSGREEKRRAMDRMLENYANATYMVIHDLSLVNFEWRDDGFPAIAMIFSPWFTRGWTAAELFMNREGKGSVKVLFKDPNPNNVEPLIKDLDTEVLVAHHQLGRVPSCAHLSVSRIVRSIQRAESGKRILSLPLLMRILRPRTTSWAKDRMILAALLCLPPDDVDTSRTSSQLTMNILVGMPQIPASYLFHGEVPINPFGAYSWCPPSLFDLGKTVDVASPYWDGGGQGAWNSVKLLNNGALMGFFYVFSLLDARDCAGILPYGSHPCVTTQIKIALDTPSNCLLLRFQDQTLEAQPSVHMWVLAHRVSQPTNHRLFQGRTSAGEPVEFMGSGLNRAIFLRYVGCVISKEPSYSKHSFGADCYFGLDDDDAGLPLPTISPFI